MKAFLQTLTLVTLAAGGFALAPSTASSPAREAENLDVDGGHSSVLFRIKHLGVAYTYGRFNELKGTVVYDEGDPSASSIEIEVDASSIDTNSKDRDQHLRSPDFFSVKEHPSITFVSTEVKEAGDGLAVAGKLTLHGVTKTVMAKAMLVGAADTAMGFRRGFVAELTIDLTDFGMTFLQQRPGAVGPEVDITISLECTKAK